MLSLFDELRRFPIRASSGHKEFWPHAVSIAQLLRERLPSKSTLLKAPGLFPKSFEQGSKQKRAVRRGLYHFRALPRVFHGLFRGLPVKDCTFSNASSLPHERTLDRVLLSAFDGAQTIHIHSAEGYFGLIQWIPLKRKGGLPQETWGLLEFWNSILGLDVFKPNDPERNSRIFADLLLPILDSHRPATWKGTLICTDGQYDHTNLNRILQKTYAYAFSTPLGNGNDFESFDPELLRVAEWIRQQTPDRMLPNLFPRPGITGKHELRLLPFS